VVVTGVKVARLAPNAFGVELVALDAEAGRGGWEVLFHFNVGFREASWPRV
jgi:hypothetical protein